MFKRAVAFVVSIALFASASPFADLTPVKAQGITQEPPEVNDQYEIRSSNSLGDYINELTQEQKDETTQESVPNAAQTAGNPANEQSQQTYSVTNLTFLPENGQVVIESSQTKNCKASIRFVDEDTQKCLIEKKLDVTAGKLILTETSVDTALLSEFYTIECVLTDDAGLPLCTPYIQDKQTRTMQEILAADIHDFNEEKVVNFDDSEDTNFLVLNDDTIIAETTAESNVLISADYDKNVFVFENPDETITSLQSGEYFYIQPTAEDIIAITVDSLVFDGDRVTITGSDENMEEMISFMKFESKADASDALIDTSAADEGVTFEGSGLEDGKQGMQQSADDMLDFQIHTQADVIENEATEAPTQQAAPTEKRATGATGSAPAKSAAKGDTTLGNNASLNFELPSDPKEAEDIFGAGVEASLSGEIGFRSELNIYKKFSHIKVDFVLEPFIKFNLKAGATLGFQPSLT